MLLLHSLYVSMFCNYKPSSFTNVSFIFRHSHFSWLWFYGPCCLPGPWTTTAMKTLWLYGGHSWLPKLLHLTSLPPLIPEVPVLTSGAQQWDTRWQLSPTSTLSFGLYIQQKQEWTNTRDAASWTSPSHLISSHHTDLEKLDDSGQFISLYCSTRYYFPPLCRLYIEDT